MPVPRLEPVQGQDPLANQLVVIVVYGDPQNRQIRQDHLITEHREFRRSTGDLSTHSSGINEAAAQEASFDFGMIETGNLFKAASRLRGGQQVSVSFPVLFFCGKRKVIGAVDGHCCLSTQNKRFLYILWLFK